MLSLPAKFFAPSPALPVAFRFQKRVAATKSSADHVGLTFVGFVVQLWTTGRFQNTFAGGELPRLLYYCFRKNFTTFLIRDRPYGRRNLKGCANLQLDENTEPLTCTIWGAKLLSGFQIIVLGLPALILTIISMILCPCFVPSCGITTRERGE